MSDGRTDPDRELSETRVADAADARRRQRRERELQIEESTLRGVLCGLVDVGHPVVVVGAGGRRTSGVLVDVGVDVIVVETTAGPVTAIKIGAVAAIEADGLSAGGAGAGRPESSDRTFAEQVADLVGTGEVVGFHLQHDIRFDGEVLGVGQDVAIVRAAGSQTIYVALDSMNEVAWSPSDG
jgi:hypothetical protein